MMDRKTRGPVLSVAGVACQRTTTVTPARPQSCSNEPSARESEAQQSHSPSLRVGRFVRASRVGTGEDSKKNSKIGDAVRR